MRREGLPERPQSAQDTSFSGLLDFLLSVLSPKQKSQIGFGLAMGLPCTWRELHKLLLKLIFNVKSVNWYFIERWDPQSHWYPPDLTLPAPQPTPPPSIFMIQELAVTML